ncbi:Pyrophosphatase PpaX [compost metagenome]
MGDGKNDIICAREAKMRSIAVAWGHNPVEILRQEAPSYVAYNVEELRHGLQALFLHTEVSL